MNLHYLYNEKGSDVIKEVDFKTLKVEETSVQNPDVEPTTPPIIIPPTASEYTNITYYVKNNGNDNANGKTEATAWKTLAKINSTKFSAGDVIAFKRGQSFKGSFEITESGTSSKNIVFTSYGTGALPILGNKEDFSGGWKNQGNNIWSKSGGADVRAWRNGVELGKANHLTSRTGGPNRDSDMSELGVVDDVFFGHNRNKIVSYLHSKTNPNNDKIELATVSSIIRIVGNYITLNQLDIRYGNRSVILVGCNNITIKNSAIGFDGATGIRAKGRVKNILIENNVLDTNFKLTFKGALKHRLRNGKVSQTGIDARGSNDGISSYGGLSDSIIRYNDFINWGHAGIAIEATGSRPTAITNIEIHHNKFTAPDVNYGRAAGWSDDVVTKIHFHHNLMDGMWIQTQPAGQYNIVEYNWFLNQNRTPWKKGGQGKGITISGLNDGSPRYNIIRYNTFKNSVEDGLGLTADSNDYIEHNTFHKNLFDNVGQAPYYSTSKNSGMHIQQYNYVGKNTFTNNAFINGTTHVNFDGHRISISQFNAKNGHKGNKISGNTTNHTDQGAGILDRSKIGVNGR